MGLVSFTVMVKEVEEGDSVVGTKPEKKPFFRGWHGSSKDD
jgi:hypothetical protein